MSAAPRDREGVRVLVLTAGIGDGHVTVARTLAEQLSREEKVEEVGLVTDLGVMGPKLGGLLTRGFHTHIERIGWSYELAYQVFFRLPWPRRAGQLALAALGSRSLRATIAGFRADIVVAEYPVLSVALGELRALRRLSVPVCSSISDPAGLYYWAHPGIDLHLLAWPESLAEVERIAGPGRAVAIRPAIDERFLSPPSWDEARAALSLPFDEPVVAVSGGGWGLGDLIGAARASLAAAPDAHVVCLAGHSERAFAELRAALGSSPRVHVLEFTERMPELLSACDVLVHTTGGTTALEARAVGCPLINYGGDPAHVRAHARAMAEWGIASWARDRGELQAALARTLGRSRPAPAPLDRLPLAAPLIVQLARAATETVDTGAVPRATPHSEAA